MIQFNHPLMDTEEYQELFRQYKLEYPKEYDYFLHLACITQLTEQQKQETEDEEEIIKCDVNIETQDEIQEEHPTK